MYFLRPRLESRHPIVIPMSVSPSECLSTIIFLDENFLFGLVSCIYMELVQYCSSDPSSDLGRPAGPI